MVQVPLRRLPRGRLPRRRQDLPARLQRGQRHEGQRRLCRGGQNGRVLLPGWRGVQPPRTHQAEPHVQRAQRHGDHPEQRGIQSVKKSLAFEK